MRRRGFLTAPLVAGVLFLCASAVRAQTRADCLQCHEDKSVTTERAGKQVSLWVNDSILHRSTHQKLVCVACHTGFNPEELPHKAKIEPVNCLRCHADATLKHAFHPQLARAIVADRKPDVSCKDCHGRHEVASPKDPGSKFSESRLIESCGKCHREVVRRFPQSEHGKALATGVVGAPNCLTCHRQPITLSNGTADSLVTKRAQARLCLSCHLDNPDVRARTSPAAGFIADYTNSVHGAALQHGNARAANCVSCHGSHDMRKGADPGSMVNRVRVPGTCSKCHAKEAREFGQSIHGVAASKGNADAPVCTQCHGEHTILAPSDPRSRVAAKNVSTQVCSPCHSSVLLSAKYGLRSDRFKTFSDSYHGLATRGGAIEVANCASCHGSHGIKASSDSTSTVNKANLAVTCGRCHPGANSRFAIGSVHLTMTAQQQPLLYWIATAYIVLIVVVVGGMGIHNALDFIHKARRKLMIRRGTIVEEPVGHALYLRMSLSERVQHAVLVLSFVTLVISGFALKFPDAWWVAAIRQVSPLSFLIRSLAHRVAGVVMVVAGLYHCYYVFATPRGKQLLRDLLPRRQDLSDAIAAMRYNLGLSPTRPQLGRFSYIEKSEYWALVWGTVIMGATGAILWFDNTFIGLLTKLGWDVAQTVHYYEAWLATLAIIVWHFYFVVFNPDVYPMNVAWFTGTLTEEEMRDEHPAELKRLKEQPPAE
jgi:cytochrome b subunit of formate dehydrogenase